jgi:RNA polymerase sigma-70 factor, ECF subfamily
MEDGKDGGLEMLNCNVRIPETADMAAVSAERENGETPLSLHSNEEKCGPAMEKFRRIAKKELESLSPFGENGLQDMSRSLNHTEFAFASTPWEQKIITFMRVAEARRTQLLWLAQRVTNNREEAEDIVQEALFKGYKHLAQFRGESMMYTWLVAIVKNVGREWLRSQKGRVLQPLEHLGVGDDVPLLDLLEDSDEDPEQFCERWEMTDILLSEINELDSVCKHALRMCAIEDRSHLEAAQALGVSVSTIKSRLFHGKRILKRAVRQRIGVRDEPRRSLAPGAFVIPMRGGRKSVRTAS